MRVLLTFALLISLCACTCETGADTPAKAIDQSKSVSKSSAKAQPFMPAEVPDTVLTSAAGAFMFNALDWEIAFALAPKPARPVEQYILSTDGMATSFPRLTVWAIHGKKELLASMENTPKPFIIEQFKRISPGVELPIPSESAIVDIHFERQLARVLFRVMGRTVEKRNVDASYVLYLGNGSVVLAEVLPAKDGGSAPVLDRGNLISRSLKWMPGFSHDGAVPIPVVGATLRLPDGWGATHVIPGDRAANWFAMAGCEKRKPYVYRMQSVMFNLGESKATYRPRIHMAWSKRTKSAESPKGSVCDMGQWFDEKSTRLSVATPTYNQWSSHTGESCWGMLRMEHPDGAIIDVLRIVTAHGTLCAITEAENAGQLHGWYDGFLRPVIPGKPEKFVFKKVKR